MATSGPLTLHVHRLSQPSRSVLMLCAAGNVEHTVNEVDIFAGEQKTEEHKAVNPVGQVPALTDGDFNLAEGAAMMEYIASTRGLTDWYPEDAQTRARVSQWMHWNHNFTRNISNQWLLPTLMQADEATRTAGMEKVKSALESFNGLLETQGTDFVAGSSPTIADLFILPEIDQIGEAGLSAVNLDDYPNVKAWVGRMHEIPACQQSITTAREIFTALGAISGSS